MEFLQRVGARLYEIRKEMKLNQAQMGEILGVSRASYSLYENGKLPIDIVMLDRLRKKTGYDTDYLIGYSDEKVYSIDTIPVRLEEGAPPPQPETGYKRMIISTDEILAGQSGRAIPFREFVIELLEEELKKREAKNDQTL